MTPSPDPRTVTLRVAPYMSDLRDQTVFITGGTQGIGFGIALELATAGCNVVIAGRDRDRASTAAEELRRLTAREILAVTLDVTKGDSVQSCLFGKHVSSGAWSWGRG